jgi:SAM-dependent methyltransferase
VGSEPDGRLRSPSFERNFEPIRATLAELLADARGTVLEIASGPGQHAAHLAAALPWLGWQPSDIDDTHLASIAAWRAHLGADNLHAPLRLDAAGPWAERPEVSACAPLAAVYAQNLLHIAPWSVTEGLVAGAGRVLPPGASLAIYGPFREGGAHTGQGNARFDAALRADNPDWGVRDLDEVAALAETAGLGPPEIARLPSNNLLVAFRRL